MDHIYRIPYDEAMRLSMDIFSACGMNETDARMLSDSLVRADMRGVKSHGLVRIPSYADQLRDGIYAAESRVETVRETPISAVLDGHKGLGAVVSYHAVELAKRKAREHGVGIVAVRGSNHYGAAGIWSYLIAQEKDLLGFTATNSVPVVAALGGTGRGIGSNPFSFAVPAQKYENMCLDISVGHMAQGKIWEYKRLNKPLPENAWMGPDGEITTDPNKFDVIDYIMLPFGGHKGFGLGVIMETLTSALADADFQDHFNGLTKDLPETCHVFAALRIDLFTDPARYRARIDRYIDYIHALPVHEGCRAPLYPGELEAQIERESREAGVPVAEQMLRDMRAAAERVGADTTGYQKYLG